MKSARGMAQKAININQVVFDSQGYHKGFYPYMIVIMYKYYGLIAKHSGDIMAMAGWNCAAENRLIFE